MMMHPEPAIPSPTGPLDFDERWDMLQALIDEERAHRGWVAAHTGVRAPVQVMSGTSLRVPGNGSSPGRVDASTRELLATVEALGADAQQDVDSVAGPPR